MNKKEQLVLSGEEAKRLYPNTAPEFKTMLESSFGKDFFIPKKITDRVKSYKDACDILGINPLTVDHFNFMPAMGHTNNDVLIKVLSPAAAFANHQLIIICAALNEGWLPNWQNGSEKKWYCWFNNSASGFAFSHATYAYSGTYAGVGSRHLLKNQDLAIYFGTQFLSIHETAHNSI